MLAAPWSLRSDANGWKPDGIGGFASSTINGCHTRRYHGLQVSATKPPVGGFVLLSKFVQNLLPSLSRHFPTAIFPGLTRVRQLREVVVLFGKLLSIDGRISPV
jgi:hypothetical protein